MRLRLPHVLQGLAVIIVGIAASRHFGWFDGFAIAAALYVLMPWEPR